MIRDLPGFLEEFRRTRVDVWKEIDKVKLSPKDFLRVSLLDSNGRETFTDNGNYRIKTGSLGHALFSITIFDENVHASRNNSQTGSLDLPGYVFLSVGDLPLIQAHTLHQKALKYLNQRGY